MSGLASLEMNPPATPLLCTPARSPERAAVFLFGKRIASEKFFPSLKTQDSKRARRRVPLQAANLVRGKWIFFSPTSRGSSRIRS
jgi:hypothetical protein